MKLYTPGWVGYNVGMIRPTWKIKWTYVLLPAVPFALLALSLSEEFSNSFDLEFYHEVREHMYPFLTFLMLWITHVGDVGVVVLLAGVGFLVPYVRRRLSIPLSTGVIVSLGTNLVLKNLFARERPNILRLINETSYSFPSGHAMVNTTLYVILVYFIWRQMENPLWRLVLSGMAVVLLDLICYSRVYLGVHYITDILGGMLFGFIIAVVVIYLFQNRLNDTDQREERTI